VTQAFSGKIDRLDINTAQSAQRVIAAAVVGGTTSVISGGKFGNGAVTGAFSRALNDETEKDGEESPQQKVDRLNKLISKDYPNLAKPKVVAVEDADTLFLSASGRYVDKNKVIVEYQGSDDFVRRSILHERLHVDELNFVVGESQNKHIFHELFEKPYFQHDTAIPKFLDSYHNYLRYPNLQPVKPNLSELPWRKKE